MGADLLVLTNRRTRLTHPKVFRASHGMVLTVPHLEFDDVAEAGAWLQRDQVTTYLADTGGTRTYREMDCSGRTAILLGNERYGISRPWYEFGFEAGVDPHARPGRLAQRVDLGGRAALRGPGAQSRLVSPAD